MSTVGNRVALRTVAMVGVVAFLIGYLFATPKPVLRGRETNPIAGVSALNGDDGGVPDRLLRAERLRTIADAEMAEFDALSRKLASTKGGRDALIRLMRRWAVEDPEAALAAAWELSKQPAAGNASRGSVPSRLEDLGADGTDRIEDPPGRLGSEVMRAQPEGAALVAVAEVWMADDPHEAMTAFQALPSTRERDLAVLAGLRAFAMQDAATAGLLFLQNGFVEIFDDSNAPYSIDDTGTVKDIFLGWAEVDRDAATANVISIKDRPTLFLAIEELASAWAMDDFEAAIAWGESLADAERGSVGLSEFVVGVASRTSSGWEGARAAAFCRENPEHPAVWGGLQSWARADPFAALAWVEESEPDPVSRVIYSGRVMDAVIDDHWYRKQDVGELGGRLVEAARDPDVRVRLANDLQKQLDHLSRMFGPE